MVTVPPSSLSNLRLSFQPSTMCSFRVELQARCLVTTSDNQFSLLFAGAGSSNFSSHILMTSVIKKMLQILENANVLFSCKYYLDCSASELPNFII